MKVCTRVTSLHEKVNTKDFNWKSLKQITATAVIITAASDRLILVFLISVSGLLLESEVRPYCRNQDNVLHRAPGFNSQYYALFADSGLQNTITGYRYHSNTYSSFQTLSGMCGRYLVS